VAGVPGMFPSDAHIVDRGNSFHLGSQGGSLDFRGIGGMCITNKRAASFEENRP